MSSSSSSSSHSSSSSSSAGTCGGVCVAEGANLDCSDCADGCICYPPFDPPTPIEIPCEPLNSLYTFESSKLQGPPLRAIVRLPIVTDPAQWRNAGVIVDQPTTPLSMPSIGWHLVFVRTNAGPANAVVTPATVPNVTIDLKDKVLSASVLLPEGGGHKQYWVPVTEQTRSAQLSTAEWTVFFIRDAMPK